MDEYEKLYNEALERARKQRNAYQKELDKTDKGSQLAGLLRAGISAIELVYPELRESEDERMMNCIIDGFKNYSRSVLSKWNNIPVEEVIAYLEKQKEHQFCSDAPKEKSVGGNFLSSHKDKNLDEIAQDYVDSVKEYNPEPTWDLMQTAVCYGYHYCEQKPEEPSDEELVRHPSITYTYPSDASKDEQLKMALLALLNSDLIKVAGSKFTKQDLIDWVENQKEQKPHFDTHWENGSMVCEKKEQKSVDIDYISGIRDELLGIEDSAKDIDGLTESQWVAIRAAHRLLGEYVEREQKPAEWKPQPESLEALMYAIEGKWEEIKPTSYLSRRLEDLYEGLVNTYNVDETHLADLPKTAYSAEDIEELKVLKDKIDASMESLANKPAEWSEEDEKIRQSIIKDIEFERNYTEATTGRVIGRYNEQLAWFKSLPERFNLQPKQEWSDEDEKTISAACCWIAEYAGYLMDKNYGKASMLMGLTEKLKSLRPSWKPSEDEERLINTSISFLKDFADKGYENAVECIDWLKSKLNGNSGK